MNKITESVVESLAISIILCYDNSKIIMNGQVIPMFKGSYVALVTPFHEDGSVNFEKLKELCRWHIDNGTDGLVILGTTGESSTTDHAEDAAIVRCAVDCVGGAIPVIAGGGSNSTETSLMKSKTFRDCGVDGLLLITPYYNKANQKGMYRHFATVAEQVNLPILLYNVPGRTGCSLSLDCIEALSKIDNIKGIKEASGNISFAAKVANLCNDDFCMMSGNDDMVVPILSLGGTGVISVFANLCPQQAHDMVAAWFDGDVRRAREIQLKYLDLINALFIEVNPIPIKEAMNLRGMEVGGYRLPLCEMDPANRARLIEAMKVLDGPAADK